MRRCDGPFSVINNPFHRWLVLDTETKDLVTVHTDGNEQLSVMRFSPGKDPDSPLTSLSISTRLPLRCIMYGPIGTKRAFNGGDCGQ